MVSYITSRWLAACIAVHNTYGELTLDNEHREVLELDSELLSIKVELQ